MQTIVAGHTTRVDVGEVNGRIFLNNASLGLYPNIVVERESLRRQGYQKWPAFALATAKVLRQFPGMFVRLTTEHTTWTSRTPFVFVGNNEYQVEGLYLGGRRRLDRGLLYVSIAPRRRVREVPKLVALALAGRALESQALESFASASLEIETFWSRRPRVALDGEVILMRPPLRCRVRPRALDVIVPAG